MPAPPPQNAHAQLRVKKKIICTHAACGSYTTMLRRLLFCVNDLQNTKKNSQNAVVRKFCTHHIVPFPMCGKAKYTKN